METTRPPGFPGKPTRTHATRSDPGEVAASTASEMRRDSLPSNARRRPSQTMHFGAQSRGLRAPCERFAPWVTPGPRITRFRLTADLGRMGLDTHRVSNKVSKITSRILVPLDRAFPAHALAPQPFGCDEAAVGSLATVTAAGARSRHEINGPSEVQDEVSRGELVSVRAGLGPARGRDAVALCRRHGRVAPVAVRSTRRAEDVLGLCDRDGVWCEKAAEARSVLVESPK